ncbi:hypothetical protein [Phreatobacter sp. AB_2022a]|uniref:hypothetical protein n=1 Tax=Phreatobacter sp. AB_2022a TaxID=3003134 RepID=UPI0022871BD6|nr:hypothetical protein [Phreatobacter sp. AB_2022a]MCZ0735847.1 hypothetical protein [Phreatobacter sp. AB_2022a]
MSGCRRDPHSLLTYGPLADNIHGFDERVRISAIRRITGAIAPSITEWCGLEPVAP